MDEHKVTFIVCVNDEEEYAECRRYLERLQTPEGYSVDIISIREASSRTSAYNAGMKSLDAKYKVYMHQDTFVKHTDFIEDILKIYYDYYGRLISEYAEAGFIRAGEADAFACEQGTEYAHKMVAMEEAVETLFAVCGTEGREKLRGLFRNGALHEWECLNEYETVACIDCQEEERQSKLRFWEDACLHPDWYQSCVNLNVC